MGPPLGKALPEWAQSALQSSHVNELSQDPILTFACAQGRLHPLSAFTWGHSTDAGHYVGARRVYIQTIYPHMCYGLIHKLTINIHICMYTCIYIYIYVDMNIGIYVYAFRYVCTYMYIYTYVKNVYIYNILYIHIYVYIHICICVYQVFTYSGVRVQDGAYR